MDNFEKMINGFRVQIQDDQPNEGHLDRFEMKLNTAEYKSRNYKLLVWPAIAAVLVLAFIIFAPDSQRGPENKTLSSLSEQYANVEFYYTSSIHQHTRKINELNEQLGDDKTIKLLVEELEEYDQLYEQLCIDLNSTPNDERVINALITYYQTKLEITQKILETIEQKLIKTNNHDNIQI
jgi:hypothetical protein